MQRRATTFAGRRWNRRRSKVKVTTAPATDAVRIRLRDLDWPKLAWTIPLALVSVAAGLWFWRFGADFTFLAMGALVRVMTGREWADTVITRYGAALAYSVLEIAAWRYRNEVRIEIKGLFGLAVGVDVISTLYGVLLGLGGQQPPALPRSGFQERWAALWGAIPHDLAAWIAAAIVALLVTFGPERLILAGLDMLRASGQAIWLALRPPQPAGGTA